MVKAENQGRLSPAPALSISEKEMLSEGAFSSPTARCLMGEAAGTIRKLHVWKMGLQGHFRSYVGEHRVLED